VQPPCRPGHQCWNSPPRRRHEPAAINADRFLHFLVPGNVGLNFSAFDEMAPCYDVSFTHTAVGQALREMVWSRLKSTFRASERVLELGCGTGEDARWLARSGIEVVATDASEKMLEIASAKLGRERGGAPVAFRCMRMEDLAGLEDARLFDGAFSNFGAINCVANLPTLVAEVARRLAPGARLVWVVMGRHVPWEWIWYTVRGKPGKALRRYKRHGAQWRGMSITYPTPRELSAVLGTHFEVVRVSALGCALPPSYAAGWLEHAPGALAVLRRLEAAAHGCPALAGIADHYILEAQLRAAA
jgi:ubiquinone/menaquinone biosynthesis C-methylase UbiE